MAVEFQLNLVNDAPEMLRVLDDHALAGLIKQPLRSGLLTGRWTPETTFPADDGRAGITFASGRGAWRLRQLNRLRPILTANGRTFTQGALGWVLARHPRTIPIPGFKTAAQVEDLLGAAAAVPLEPADMAAIEAALAARGSRPPSNGPRREPALGGRTRGEGGHRVDELPDRARRLVERGLLVAVSSISMICSMPVGAEHDRHADEEAVDAVLALQYAAQGRMRFLSLEDRFDHLRPRRRRARSRRSRS